LGQWKLGYVNALDGAANYTAGKTLHDSFGVVKLTLDTTKMCRAVGQAAGDPSTVTMTCDNIINYPNVANTTFAAAVTAAVFEVDEFNSGFVRFLSGTCENNVYQITDTVVSPKNLVSATDLYAAGVRNNDYFEVVTGSCTFEFPADRNPIRRDFKRVFKGTSLRFPFYEGGLVMPIGYEADDMVIMTYLTDERDVDRLELMLNHLLDYKGEDGMYSTGGSGDNSDGLAPMILETGTNDIRNQYLAHISDHKIVKDAKKSDNFWDVLIHLQNYTRPLYSGI
jgi:hypothetical protein